MRLALSEKGVTYEIVREYPWDPSEKFLTYNPAGRTPVMRFDARDLSLADSRAICEYFEETGTSKPLILGSAVQRAEIRRMVALFDENFFGDVTHPLMIEKLTKRVVLRLPPDSKVLRETMRLAHEHLDYIDWLLDHHRWLAGAQLSLADFAAAAQISVADYLGGIDWNGHEGAHAWYRVMKSRPSFRPLLTEKMENVPPPAHYADVNA